MGTEWITGERLRDEFGDVMVRFSSYYKYQFSFGADLPDGRRLLAYVGGDHDSIYRLSVGTEEIAVKLLYADEGCILSAADTEGKE